MRSGVFWRREKAEGDILRKPWHLIVYAARQGSALPNLDEVSDGASSPNEGNQAPDLSALRRFYAEYILRVRSPTFPVLGATDSEEYERLIEDAQLMSDGNLLAALRFLEHTFEATQNVVTKTQPMTAEATAIVNSLLWSDRISSNRVAELKTTLGVEGGGGLMVVLPTSHEIQILSDSSTTGPTTLVVFDGILGSAEIWHLACGTDETLRAMGTDGSALRIFMCMRKRFRMGPPLQVTREWDAEHDEARLVSCSLENSRGLLTEPYMTTWEAKCYLDVAERFRKLYQFSLRKGVRACERTMTLLRRFETTFNYITDKARQSDSPPEEADLLRLQSDLADLEGVANFADGTQILTYAQLEEVTRALMMERSNEESLKPLYTAMQVEKDSALMVLIGSSGALHRFSSHTGKFRTKLVLFDVVRKVAVSLNLSAAPSEVEAQLREISPIRAYLRWRFNVNPSTVEIARDWNDVSRRSFCTVVTSDSGTRMRDKRLLTRLVRAWTNFEHEAISINDLTCAKLLSLRDDHRKQYDELMREPTLPRDKPKIVRFLRCLQSSRCLFHLSQDTSRFGGAECTQLMTLLESPTPANEIAVRQALRLPPQVCLIIIDAQGRFHRMLEGLDRSRPSPLIVFDEGRVEGHVIRTEHNPAMLLSALRSDSGLRGFLQWKFGFEAQTQDLERALQQRGVSSS